MEQSEYQRRRSSPTHSMAIACRVCDRIFFDNVSLALHFECHLKDGTPTPYQCSGTLASLQSDRPSSLNSSQFSCSFVERMSEASHVQVPRTRGYSRPCSLPVCSTKTPNVFLRGDSPVEYPVLNSMPPLDSSYDAQLKLSQSTLHSTLSQNAAPVRYPVLNSMPPLNSSSDAQLNRSQSTLHSTMSQNTATSSLSLPLFYSRLGTNRVARRLATVPVQLNEQIGGGHYSSYWNLQTKQTENPDKEIIVISDDEEDANKSPIEMLDLTLKL